MLESENGNNAAESLPQPPAPRRRSASRAAGPPPEGAAPADVPRTAAAQPDQAAPAAEAPEPPKRSRRATRASAPAQDALVESAPTASEDADAKAPARTKRAPVKSRARTVPAAEESGTGAAEAPAAEDSATERPRRTRRAPRAAAATVDAETVQAQDVPETSAPKTAAAEAAPVGTAPEEKPPTRRRRAATRPAAAPSVEATPAPVEVTQAAVATETTPVTADQRGEQAADEQKPPTRRRRAATRAAAAPEARAPEIEATPPTAEEGSGDNQNTGDRPATRRRRSTREAGSVSSIERPVVSEGGSDVGAALDALTAEIASSQGKDASATTGSSAPAAAEDRPSTRRRRSTRAAAPASAVEESTEDRDDEPVDGIAAALKMAEDDARSRRAIVSDPFRVTAESRQVRLDELAQSIATGDSEQDSEEDSEDAEEDVDDDSDDDSSDDDSDEDSSDDDSSDSGQDSDGDGGGNRRRRRRGGRRRRRGGSNNRDGQDSDDWESDSSDSDDSDSGGSGGVDDSENANDTDDPSPTDSDSDSDSDGDDASGSGTTRRRRRRRRSGSDSGDSVKSTGQDAITGIEGSTRMEAKRQRRKENRSAGRRRAPILSEAEFLARREAVDRKLVIRQGEEYTQLAVVEDNILVEHYVDRASAMSLIGNVYLGKVQNVLPSMEAAFIDIGRGRNAVLYAGEVDWSGFHVSSEDRRVEKVFKSGQPVLVQVTKDPVGAKGARLTGHISLPGRYVVYSPGGHLSGISRKLPDQERSRLREILAELIGDDESVIVRTAAEGASSEELVRDVNRLKAQWEVIEKKSKQGGAPAALYSEPDLTLRIVRDLFTEDFGALVVQGNGGAEDSFDEINAYVAHVAPNLADRVQHFNVDETGHDAFTEYRIDEQIAKALDRKVHLPSGGSLVIDRTEAMTVIDVNTGRFTGAGGNLEATVTSNNLEAAEEVVRQLRLRDIGGIIVVDFIDMVLPSNRDLLLRRLVECLGRDRTRHQVAEVTSLGLIQLTRKKIGTGLAEAFTEDCEHCHGDGYLRFHEPVDSQAPSDGGDRRSHGGNSGGGSGSSSGSGSGGNRGRGGRSRRGGGSSNHGGGNGGNGGEKKSD